MAAQASAGHTGYMKVYKKKRFFNYHSVGLGWFAVRNHQNRVIFSKQPMPRTAPEDINIAGLKFVACEVDDFLFMNVKRKILRFSNLSWGYKFDRYDKIIKVQTTIV